MVRKQTVDNSLFSLTIASLVTILNFDWIFQVITTEPTKEFYKYLSLFSDLRRENISSFSEWAVVSELINSHYSRSGTSLTQSKIFSLTTDKISMLMSIRNDYCSFHNFSLFNYNSLVLHCPKCKCNACCGCELRLYFS